MAISNKNLRWLLLALLCAACLLATLISNGQAGALAHPNADVEEMDVVDDDGLAFDDDDDDTEDHGDDHDDDDDEDEEELDGDYELGPSADLTTAFWFPGQPLEDAAAGKMPSFPLGEPVDVVVNLHNHGSQTFNISFVQVVFRSPFDLSYFIQNFTAKPVSTLLAPEQQLSIEYTFFPEPSLDPTKFWLTGFVGFNNTANRPFLQTWHNSTVEMVSGGFAFDITSALQYLLLLALASVGLYFVYIKYLAAPATNGSRRPASSITSESKSRRAGGKKGKKDSSKQPGEDTSVGGGWEDIIYQHGAASKGSLRRRGGNKKSK